ncbi:hypothetical protein Droror1_Dr00027318 [Drosera rotundifolia]
MEPPVCSRATGGGRNIPFRIHTENITYKIHFHYSQLKINSLFTVDKANYQQASRIILQDVNCEARPGELTAIAGPSGAGKTTLLEILGANIPPSKISGKVFGNGHPINPKTYKRLSGYVTQVDELYPLLTVEETLMFSALWRLPVGRKEVLARVRQLIKELGLNRVASSRISGGISGGERRRVSIGVELVHDPPVLMIDEPTSGLDSVSALNIVKLLKYIAVQQGKTIVITIHQPGTRILELLDRVILLDKGHILHNGPTGILQEKIIADGNDLPLHANVLECAIDVSSSLLRLPSEGKQSKANRNKDKLLKDIPSCSGEEILCYPNSQLGEVLIQVERFSTNILRAKQLFTMKIIQAGAAGIILGTIFSHTSNEQGQLSLQSRLGFFAFTLTFLLSSTTEGLPIFLQERRIVMRETSRGAYRLSSYVLSNTLVFLPFLVLISLLYSMPVYWLVGLRKDLNAFLYFSLVVWMVVLMSTSFVACFSALAPNFIMGNSVISGLMGSFFLFSGYFISKDNIPKYWIFMHYLSLFKYPFECFVINEYEGEREKSICAHNNGTGCVLYGIDFLRQQGLDEQQKWTNLLVMTGFIVGYRVLSYFVLLYRCYRSRN